MAEDSEKGVVIPLSRFRARLARPRASKRIDELISTPDPQAAVAAMTVPEIYSLIAEVGLADSMDLVALATAEQVQGCLDLEIWDRDRVQVEAVMPWLAVLMEAGFEKVGQIWEGLDPELAALIIAKNTRVSDLTLGEEPPQNSEAARIETPDRFFIVELDGETGEDDRLISELIGDLYRYDLAVARHTLMSARSEVGAELEEMCYRWRSGRLADLGYPDFFEALTVFRPLDPSSIEIGEGTAERPAVGGEEAARGPGELPVPMLERVMGRVFLARALGEIRSEDEVKRLEASLIMLVNRVLAAARVSPGDEEAVAVGTEHATATLALGLETVSRGELEAAKNALQTVSLVRLHRVGYTVTLGLARAARQLAPRATSAGHPSPTVLDALLGQRPFFPRFLESEPHAGIRPIESLQDVAVCAEHLRSIATRIAIVTALGVDLIALREVEDAPTLDAYGQTAVAHAILDGTASTAALDSTELEKLCAQLASGVDEAAIAAAVFAAASSEDPLLKADDVGVVVAGWHAALDDELSGLDGEEIDPRFVTAVVLGSARD